MEQEAPRKQKLLACRRCRHRKQKCTEVRPCENCIQSGSECILSESATSKPPFGPEFVYLSHDPSSYVQRLEERVAQLESLLPQESLDHINSTQGQERRPSAPRPDFQPTFAPDRHQPHLNHTDAFSFLHNEPSDFAAPPNLLAYSPPDNTSPGLFGALTGIPNDRPSTASNDGMPLETPALDPESEQFLIQTYFNMAHSQYPLLLKHEFLRWAEAWRAERDAIHPSMRWKGFFVYMVYAIAFLMTTTRINGPMRSQAFYTLATTKYLSYLVAMPDAMVRAQGFLLLTIFALHTPSQDKIIMMSSWMIRYCIKSQLHLAETEPRPTSNEALIHIQHRRRVFWCAYGIDRAVCSSYGLPCSIPDNQITVPIFDNVDDEQFLAAASPGQQSSLQGYIDVPTNVSPSLHVLRSRQLESEIQELILSKDFVPHSDDSFEWRAKVLDKLKEWNEKSLSSAKPSRKGYVSLEWLKMIYYYNVVMLYRPTRAICPGVAGDLSVQACCQALLLFRKFQMAREIAQPWLGLLTQFQIGVTLLYCFYATPTAYWKASYKSADVPGAIRACSSTLAILAERWAEAEFVRDTFEILAKEVPISQAWDRPRTMSQAGRAGIEENWKKMSEVVIHRPTLCMIQEMATEEFVDVSDVDSTGFIGAAMPPDAVGVPSSLTNGMDLQWDLGHDSITIDDNFGSGGDYATPMF